MANLIEFNSIFPNEKACVEHLATLRWGDFPVCQHCGSNNSYFLEVRNIYKCADCGKQYSVRYNTIFEDSRLPLQKWFMAIYLLTSRKKGISSMQLSRDLGITQKTAWFVLHRVRYAMNTPEFKAPLKNTIEADETYIGGKKKGGKRGRGTEKTAVFGMVERKGQARMRVVDKTDGATLVRQIIRNAPMGRETRIITDDYGAYRWLGRHYSHDVISHSAKQYVRGSVHTNSIEGFWSHLKRGINGVYLHVSKKHLQKYCDEYVYRFNTRQLADAERFDKCLAIESPKITYKQLKLA